MRAAALAQDARENVAKGAITLRLRMGSLVMNEQVRATMHVMAMVYTAFRQCKPILCCQC